MRYDIISLTPLSTQSGGVVSKFTMEDKVRIVLDRMGYSKLSARLRGKKQNSIEHLMFVRKGVIT